MEYSLSPSLFAFLFQFTCDAFVVQLSGGSQHLQTLQSTQTPRFLVLCSSQTPSIDRVEILCGANCRALFSTFCGRISVKRVGFLYRWVGLKMTPLIHATVEQILRLHLRVSICINIYVWFGFHFLKLGALEIEMKAPTNSTKSAAAFVCLDYHRVALRIISHSN